MRPTSCVLAVLAASAPACSAPGDDAVFGDTTTSDASSSSSAAASSASTGTGGNPMVCTPGAQITCDCPGGAKGVQVCNVGGTGLDPCQCGGAGGTTGVGGAGGSGGAAGGGGAGGSLCAPGSAVSCYTGPVGSEGVGVCVPGTKTCSGDGSAYGPCLGQVTPKAETCLTLADDDCDGETNEEGAGCNCIPGAQVACYSGPLGTKDVGLCKGGTQVCDPDGMGYGTCTGEIIPQPETCVTPDDENCNGASNEGGAACVCVPGAMVSCYSGLAGTEGIGPCKAGSKQCAATGTGFEACFGEVTPSVDDCMTAADEDCNGMPAVCGNAGQHLWSKAFGDIKTQEVYAFAVDATGSACFAGALGGGTMTVGGMTIGGNGANVYLAKLDASGNGLWAKAFGDSSSMSIEGIAMGPSNDVVITGYFKGSVSFGGAPLVSMANNTGDVFIARFDALGNHLWSKRFGDSDQQFGYRVVFDATGNIAVMGTFQGSIFFGGAPLISAGANDVFVAKLDGSGNYLWSKRFGGTESDGAGAFAADATGRIVFGGGFGGVADMGGGFVQSEGVADAFLTSLDAMGNVVFAKTFGNPQWQTFADLAIDSAGTVFAVGSFEGALDFGGGVLTANSAVNLVVAKFSAAGAHLASKRFGSPNAVSSTGIAVDGAGNIVVAGGFQGGNLDFGGGSFPYTGSNGTDAFIAKLSPSLQHVWSKKFGSSGDTTVRDVVTDPAGNALIAGRLNNAVDFGGGPLANAGYDTYVAKFAP